MADAVVDSLTGSAQTATEKPPRDVSFVDRLWDNGLQALQPYHRQWYINIAFLLGFQHLVWHPTNNRLWLPPGQRRRIRMTSNRIMPAFRINLSKLVSLDTQVAVRPNSGEQEDMDAARLGRHFWEHIKHEIEWKAKKRAIGSWALSAGNAFVEALWDKNSGERLLARTSAGQPEEIRAGKIFARYISPFAVVPVGQGNSVEDLQGLIIGDWMPMARIREEFPDKAKDVKPSERKKGSTFEERLESLVSPSTGTQTRQFATEDDDKGALVLRYYERESSEYPQGRLIIRAGGVTLHDDINPTPPDADGRVHIPVVQYKDIDIPFRFWGRSFIEDMIPDQKGYNKMESSALEHLAIAGKPKALVPRGAKLKETSMDNSPDEVLEYTPVAGLKPDWMRLEPVPQAYFVMMDRHSRNMDDQSGVREASRGINPPGARSGLAIQELQEADNTQIAITSQGFSDADAKVASLILRITEKYMMVPQKIRIVGRNSMVDIIEEKFTGNMLRGNTQVISAGPTIPFSLIAKKAEILDLVSMGILGMDEETGKVDSRLVLDLLDFERTEDVFSDRALEETRIAEENRMMIGLRGIPVAKPYQNHMLHIKGHNRKRLTPEYQRLVETEIEIEGTFQAHIDEHANHLRNEVLAMEGGGGGDMDMGTGQTAPPERPERSQTTPVGGRPTAPLGAGGEMPNSPDFVG